MQRASFKVNYQKTKKQKEKTPLENYGDTSPQCKAIGGTTHAYCYDTEKCGGD